MFLQAQNNFSWICSVSLLDEGSFWTKLQLGSSCVHFKLDDVTAIYRVIELSVLPSHTGPRNEVSYPSACIEFTFVLVLHIFQNTNSSTFIELCLSG